ncbi:MAG: hypothetical protein SFV23_24000 [Planctomycetaceae bacterium]|nr:hypothetical protein [Planctomycetaceae bacterium]
MSRRRRAEQQFGSDSFLDVISNVVGILIILMVIAGVRACRNPVILPSMSVETPRVAVAAAEPESLPLFVPLADDEPILEAPTPSPEPAPDEPIEPPVDLVDRAGQLRRELAELEALASRTVDEVGAVKRAETALKEQLATIEKQKSEQSERMAAMLQRRSASQVELEHMRRIAAQLAQAVQEQSAKAPASKTLEHRITPIGRTVTGTELHFRVLNDKVAVVPLERLIGRLQGQIERHKDWIAKSRQQLGQVGPLDGFTMHYVVEREAPSLADELRMGPGVFKISVTEWRLEAERGVPAETVEQALRPGSRFLDAVATADPGSAMTFWVYPDSFGAFGQLKSHCQKLNFLIAGRPLPDGVPIAGSPTGTRSTGQ